MTESNPFEQTGITLGSTEAIAESSRVELAGVVAACLLGRIKQSFRDTAVIRSQ